MSLDTVMSSDNIFYDSENDMEIDADYGLSQDHTEMQADICLGEMVEGEQWDIEKRLLNIDILDPSLRNEYVLRAMAWAYANVIRPMSEASILKDFRYCENDEQNIVNLLGALFRLGKTKSQVIVAYVNAVFFGIIPVVSVLTNGNVTHSGAFKSDFDELGQKVKLALEEAGDKKKIAGLAENELQIFCPELIHWTEYHKNDVTKFLKWGSMKKTFGIVGATNQATFNAIFADVGELRANRNKSFFMDVKRGRRLMQFGNLERWKIILIADEDHNSQTTADRDKGGVEIALFQKERCRPCDVVTDDESDVEVERERIYVPPCIRNIVCASLNTSATFPASFLKSNDILNLLELRITENYIGMDSPEYQDSHPERRWVDREIVPSALPTVRGNPNSRTAVYRDKPGIEKMMDHLSCQEEFKSVLIITPRTKINNNQYGLLQWLVDGYGKIRPMVGFVYNLERDVRFRISIKYGLKQEQIVATAKKMDATVSVYKRLPSKSSQSFRVRFKSHSLHQCYDFAYALCDQAVKIGRRKRKNCRLTWFVLCIGGQMMREGVTCKDSKHRYPLTDMYYDLSTYSNSSKIHYHMEGALQTVMRIGSKDNEDFPEYFETTRTVWLTEYANDFVNMCFNLLEKMRVVLRRYKLCTFKDALSYAMRDGLDVQDLKDAIYGNYHLTRPAINREGIRDLKQVIQSVELEPEVPTVPTPPSMTQFTPTEHNLIYMDKFRERLHHFAQMPPDQWETARVDTAWGQNDDTWRTICRHFIRNGQVVNQPVKICKQYFKGTYTLDTFLRYTTGDYDIGNRRPWRKTTSGDLSHIYHNDQDDTIQIKFGHYGKHIWPASDF